MGQTQHINNKHVSINQTMQNQYKPEFFNYGNSISVMTYNVLAAAYCDKSVFKYAEQQNLYFANRADKVLNQVRQFDPDIICLQELDFYSFYKSHLETNYELIFTQRPTREDGCLICFKKDKFKLIKFTPYSLDKIAINYGLGIQYQRQNVFQIAILEHQLSKKQIIIGNIHTFWNPLQDDLKYFQVVQLIQCMEAEDISQETIKIICGDFNSLPQSNPISYINQQIPTLERIEVKGSMQIKLMKQIYHKYGPPKLQWKSSYDPYPNFTNYTQDFKGCIDYIFYENAIVKKVLKIPDVQYLNEEIALPNTIFPSDHLPLLSYFEFN